MNEEWSWVGQRALDPTFFAISAALLIPGSAVFFLSATVTTDGSDINADAVFVNNEISFKYIDVYGFDYDYTIANYSADLHNTIYDIAVDNLIEMFGYPKQIRSMKYDPGFAIRGLHFDTRKGLLMKLDSFSHIQLGTVYRGRQELNSWDVVNHYAGTHLPIDQISRGTKRNGAYIHQLIDLFSMPFMGLLSNVIEVCAILI